jgi:hypothetical protein
VHPLYFLPGINAMSSEHLVAHSLDRVLGQSYQSQQTFRGPGGQSGIMICDASVPPDRMLWVPDEQVWTPRFGFTSLVGTWKDAPPTAAELQREQVLPGCSLKLLDDSDWEIPILRAWRDGDNLLEYDIRLPRVMQQCAETGRWLVTAVVPQYRQLWDTSMKIAEALFDQLRGNDSAELEWQDVFDFAVALLQVNYRIDSSLLSHMQVLQPTLAAEIARRALDWDTLRAHLKNALSRRLSGGTNSESGPMPPTEA